MRVSLFVIGILSAAVAAANNAAVVQPGTTASNLVTSTRTPTADAPAFGTASYFRKVFVTPTPKIELQSPTRLTDFIVGDKIEMSLRNYVDAVLANNTDIQIQRLTIETPRNQILRQHGIFDPVLDTSFAATRRETPTVERFIGTEAQFGSEVASALSQPFALRARKLLPTGTQLVVGYDANRFSNTTGRVMSDGTPSPNNPGINSNLNLSFSQPLLRNRGSYFTKMPITIARSRLRASEYQIEDQIMRLVSLAENAYWEVVSARENLRVQEQALELFKKSLERSQRELELGAISELEIYQPQAQAKNAEIQVTQARFRLQQAEDALRRQIGADLDPQLRNLPIVLTEDVAAPVATDLDKEAIVEKALRQRPDLRAARQNIDISDLQIQQTANFLKPDLRLTGQYGSFGRNAYTGVNGDRVALLDGGFSNSLGQLFGFTYPVYGFGLTLSLPLRDRRASADYADAVVNKRLETLRVRTQEQQARLEVLNAISQVEQSRASIDLAKVALELAEQRAAAEQKKFDLGTTVMFFVLDAQTALAQAQSALVNQTVNYRRNLTNLMRVTGDLLTERGIQIQ
jgi:outer membrane protein TolC